MNQKLYKNQSNRRLRQKRIKRRPERHSSSSEIRYVYDFINPGLQPSFQSKPEVFSNKEKGLQNNIKIAFVSKPLNFESFVEILKLAETQRNLQNSNLFSVNHWYENCLEDF